jgi:hypothetical protein
MVEIMCHLKSFLLVPLITLGCSLSPSRALAQGSFLMTNGTGEPVNVWLWPRGANAWSKPVFLPKMGDVRASLESPGDYYVVVRDMASAEDHLRWYDFHALVRDLPDAKLTLTGGHIVIQKQATRIVQACVQVAKEVVVPVCQVVPVICRNGRVVYQYVIVYEIRTIAEYQLTQKEETVTYLERVFKVDLKASSGTKEVDIAKYRVVEGLKK